MIKHTKKVSIALAAICAVCSLGIEALNVQAADYWPEGPEVESPCVIVMEANTGTILYEKNSHEQHYPASITKIMTSMLILENSSMDEIVTFSHDSVYKTEGSGISRDVGEEMTMEDTLYAIMLESANECAYAAAEHVGGGSLEVFIQMMNDKAKELGCTDTHFNNPHGLTDEEHYTSCYDMALIARAAYQKENFRVLTGTARHTIAPTNKHDEETYLKNHNEMLYPYRKTQYQYEYCTGGKTGYTDAANSTLVTYAEKDGLTLICIIMNANSPSQWTDSINLHNYCFDNFQILNISDNETRYETDEKNAGKLNNNESYVKLDEEAVIVIPKTAEFHEAEPKITYDKADSNVVASLEYTFAGHVVGEADITATGATVEMFPFDNLVEETEMGADENNKKVFQIDVKKVIFVLLGMAAVAVCIFLIAKLVDNFYIIKHKIIGSRKYRQPKYRTIKDTRKHRRRHHRRRKLK